jgi:hypothetical protein
MLIASVFAPAAGGAVISFCTADWHEAMLVSRVFGSLVGGFVLLAFVWFWTIPLGFLTSFIGFALREANLKNIVVWEIGGAACGFVVGEFLVHWANLQPALSFGSGVPIGFLTGLALRGVWIDRGGKDNETSRQSNRNADAAPSS